MSGTLYRLTAFTDEPRVGNPAGVWHLVLACKTQQRLERLEYDFERLKALMLCEGHFHARDSFPVGGVVEDPATGAAAVGQQRGVFGRKAVSPGVIWRSTASCAWRVSTRRYTSPSCS